MSELSFKLLNRMLHVDHQFQSESRLPSVLQSARMSLLSDSIQVELGATERWPEDVKLVQTYQAEQMIMSDYANCLSVRTFLRMCQLPFTQDLRTNAEEMSPSGQVPFIKAGPFLIAGFEPIVGFVKRRGFDLSKDLDSELQAELQAYVAMIHSVLVNAELHLCWVQRSVADEITKLRYGSVHPWPLNHIIPFLKQREIKRKLDGVGWYKKTVEEVEEEVRSCCQALSERLGEGRYFFGDEPTELDALVFGHLFTLYTTKLPEVAISIQIEKFPNILKFLKHVEGIYFREKEEE